MKITINVNLDVNGAKKYPHVKKFMDLMHKLNGEAVDQVGEDLEDEDDDTEAKEKAKKAAANKRRREKAAAKKKAEAAAAAAADGEDDEDDEEGELTLQDVKKIMSTKVSKHRDAIRAELEDMYGVKGISGLSEADYPSFAEFLKGLK